MPQVFAVPGCGRGLRWLADLLCEFESFFPSVFGLVHTLMPVSSTVTSPVNGLLQTPPELLAPAGDWECVRAAVENGADAIYLGLDDGFNARARATNFDLDSIPELMRFLHQRGVRGYITLNTLAFSNELAQVESIARRLAEAGVDAVLVQDLGVARLIRAAAPDLLLHASTQMTLTSAECIDVVAELGISRVVLARELSLDEIRAIRAKTQMPLEVFVHGALCVAYSGQCLTSESLGGRSANRGQCAQACRLPYELVCDGELRDLGVQRYLLSPQDLAAWELTGELIDAGVCSFKIEGRLKTPEYVANITRHYREALDTALSGRPVEFSRRQIQQMEQSFSRGFSPGWLRGCDHKMLVPADSSAKRGVWLGEVVQVLRDRVAVRLEYSVAAGDGVVFEGDRVAGEEQGGRVFEVFVAGVRQSQPCDSGVVELSFDRRGLELRQLYPGQRVWKTDDPRLNQQLRRTFTAGDPRRRVRLDLSVQAEPGQPLQVVGRTSTGLLCRAVSPAPLPVAQRHPLTVELLREQLGRLGGTVYELGQLDARITGSPMVPLSVLGAVRRQLVEQLEAAPVRPVQRVAPQPALPLLRARLPVRANLRPHNSQAVPETAAGQSVQLTVLCRSSEQLQQLLRCREDVAEAASDGADGGGSASVTVQLTAAADFADIREYREAVALARSAGLPLWLATPRIQKPDEMGLFRVLRRYQPDGILVRNLSGMRFFLQQGVPVIGDFSLNVTNELTADYLMGQGLQRVTASYDLNRDQLLELARVVPPEWLEVVIHQQMPMFHMEHCVFCAVLSPGTNKTNCGRPCDVHQVELRDRLHVDHPLTADVGCRNTLFNAVPQSSAEIVPELLAQGIRQFRIELLRQSAEQVAEVVQLYRRLLLGRLTGSAVWKSLNATNQVGVTRGTLEPRRNPLALL